jgi:CotH kinase protein
MKVQLILLGCASLALAQPPDFGPGGFGGRGPGSMNQTRKILADFDKDKDGYLDAAERKAAREWLAVNPRGRGPFGRGAGPAQPVSPGSKLTSANVKKFGNEPLYDMQVLRTLFLEFQDADWEQELVDFYRTDVDVPAALTVDGKVYPEVGVHFRGNTSFMAVPPGRKHSINLSLSYAYKDQKLGGYRTLNLLNSNQDPTFLRTVLYQYISRQYIPAPKANYMRVAINGESWGVYVNVEQFNSDFTQEAFGSIKGARWKVPGSPGARGGLVYTGDDVAAYKRAFEIKTRDDPKSWADLIHLCKVLNETPPDTLQKELAPLLDIDGTLKFLAVDKALINNDGYWVRTSDYSLYEEPNGRFHLIPQDANETLQEIEQMGRGRSGQGSGPGAGQGAGQAPTGVALDPFEGANDPQKALLYRLLAVPALRARYLSYVRDIAEKWLDWSKIGPLAQQFQAVIAEDIKADTKKLDTTENFTKGLTQDNDEPAAGGPGGFGPGGFGPGGFGGPGGRGGFGAAPRLSIKGFVEQRRAYLLNHADVKQAARL